MLKTLTRLFPSKVASLQTKFSSVAGFTGHGAFSYATYSSGERAFDVELRGAAGKFADIYADDTHLAQITLNNGRSVQTFDTRQGHVISTLEEGMTIEIRQNGQVVLEGCLIAD